MRWREWRWLMAKEWRELAASRAAALVLLVVGVLVGQAFATATTAYAEASGSAGGAAALAQGLSPLDGIVVPVFGAYALAATLLLPFAAIRLVSAEKESGALRLLLQMPVSQRAMVFAKASVALCAWVVAWIPGIIALAWWRSIGGHLSTAEVGVVLSGHLLHGALVIALAFAAAAVTENAASAAVLTLAITLGTWALDFVAQVRGGLWQRVAEFTPDATLRQFEHGELRASVVVVTAMLVMFCLTLAVIWLGRGASVRTRVLRTALVAALAALGGAIGSRAHASWDFSEDRRNSLPPADEAALRSVVQPLIITAHLAPEDPRLVDLQRGVFHKLSRTMEHVTVHVTARTGSGLFERPDGQYGEVWYQLGERRAMSRSSTEPIVLETIYGLAGITPPTAGDTPAYSGYPLARQPDGVPVVYYVVWPVLVLGAAWMLRRRVAGASR